MTSLRKFNDKKDGIPPDGKAGSFKKCLKISVFMLALSGGNAMAGQGDYSSTGLRDKMGYKWYKQVNDRVISNDAGSYRDTQEPQKGYWIYVPRQTASHKATGSSDYSPSAYPIYFD